MPIQRLKIDILIVFVNKKQKLLIFHHLVRNNLALSKADYERLTIWQTLSPKLRRILTYRPKSEYTVVFSKYTLKTVGFSIWQETTAIFVDMCNLIN
jgi:hypothetical protein